MRRHLTEHLAELAAAPLSEWIAPGEGFEVIVSGAAARWRQAAAPQEQDGSVVWQLEQIGGPLRAQVRFEADPPHRAAAYRVELSNAGGPAVTLDAIHPLVVRFPRSAGPWRALRARGGSSENFYPPRAYSPAERVVFGGEVRIESGPGGRSSNQHLPLLLAAAGADDDAPGVFAALEYSGEWFLCLRHVGDGPFLRGRLKMNDVVVAPNETLRLPPVHLGFFAGGLDGGANALRAYVRDRICPTPPDAVALPPVSYNTWFGIYDRCDEKLLRRQVKRCAQLGAEYWIHDAGWFEGGFPAGVGNWHRADPARYPRGLMGLAEAVRAAGMGFGLWFEIERAEAGTWAAEQYPQLFFPPQTSWAGHSRHLDLTRPDARDWAIETIGRWIGPLDLAWVKLDYNIEPAPFLHAADPSGRIQLDYYDGLYWVLDELMRRHPRVLFEACASGGRRIDLATLRRAHVCWISDQSFTPDVCRYMQLRFARLLPSHLACSAVCVGPKAGRHHFVDFDALSRMCGALSFHGDVASWPAATVRRMRKWVDAYRRVRHLLSRNFHQLLEVPATDRQWDAVQFAAEDGAESVVFAFRAGGDRQRTVLPLRGLDPQASYAITDFARPSRTRTAGGDRLMGKGLPVRLKPHAGACIHLTKRADPGPD